MSAPSISNRSKNASGFIAQHKLQPPLWEWAPFFLGLPTDVKEIIFSQVAFQIPGSAHPRRNYFHIRELLNKRVSLEHSHPFNTLAATSRSMRDSIEAYSQHLLKKHCNDGCSKCGSKYDESISLNLSAFRELPGAEDEDREDEARKQLERTPSTHRGIWLRHIAHSCAFCGRTTVKYICPFNRTIKTCADCELKQWPNRITLETAMKKLPLHHILWPPQGYVLQWARICRHTLDNNPDQPDFLDILLNDEVEAVVDVVEKDPVRHTPAWAMCDDRWVQEALAVRPRR
ncbi:hypothetical protein FKW77_010380 [Venturia effusa]|uniref:Uncharacterized protein n=1 Tax=Venturia effusa TaxID=50376 RepID=A0A517L6F4_9PEZI|nr:hypothetical protein FKW77_010380 [Venturia effusa]